MNVTNKDLTPIPSGTEALVFPFVRVAGILRAGSNDLRENLDLLDKPTRELTVSCPKWHGGFE
jgi:hypothetical protein